MYKIEGRKITKEETLRFFKEDEYLMKNAKKISKKLSSDYFVKNIDEVLEENAEELVNINNAILNDRQFFCEVVKEPSNLDSGSHYYRCYYLDIDKNNQPYMHRIFAPLFMSWHKKLGWTFKSGAIGMSRQLDATDYLFSVIKSIGGCYIQI